MRSVKRFEIIATSLQEKKIPRLEEENTISSTKNISVRIIKSDNSEWIKSFEPGWTNFTGGMKFENSENFIIIANGTCYIMNPNQNQPIANFGVGFCGIFKASKNRIVLQDQVEFTIVENDGKFWDTERISWDGFKKITVKQNIIRGKSYRPVDEWISFSYDIDKKELKGGAYNNIKYKKKWWQKLFKNE